MILLLLLLAPPEHASSKQTFIKALRGEWFMSVAQHHKEVRVWDGCDTRIPIGRGCVITRDGKKTTPNGLLGELGAHYRITTVYTIYLDHQGNAVYIDARTRHHYFPKD